MVYPPHRLTAVATALIVFAAHLLCACTTARAASPRDVATPEGDPAHRCCQPADATGRHAPAEHRQHDPHDGDCPHCGGAATVTAPQPGGKAGHLYASLELNPFTLAAGAMTFAPPALDCAAHRADAIPPPALSPATLLGLRCALTL
jgi:hypothetical protein